MTSSAQSSESAGSTSTPTQRQTAVTMLSMGLVGERRPLDKLIERLSRDPHHQWLYEMMRRQDRLLPIACQSMLDGSATVPQLTRVKELSKSEIAAAETTEYALAALATYCLSVGSALAHHGVLISSQPREEWDALLIDLADVMPQAWRELLLRAVMRD